MRKAGAGASSLILAVVIFSAVSLMFAQAGGDVGSGAPKLGDKKKDKKDSRAADPCSSKMTTESFVVDFSGSVSNTGRTYEGPLCIEVFYNPIQLFVGLQSVTTTVNGPDASKVLLGGSTSGGAKEESEEPAASNLPTAFAQIRVDAKKLTANLNTMKQDYRAVMQREDEAISAIAQLRQTTMLLSGTDAVAKVKSGYEGLKETLNSALTKTADFIPSDQFNNKFNTKANALSGILLSDAQAHEDRLNTLPLDFATGNPKGAAAEDRVGWSDWSATNKDQYTALKTTLDANLQAAKDFTSDSDNVKALKKKIAIVKYWDTLFSTLGLLRNLTIAQIEALDISPRFYTRTGVRCGILFNQTANTAVNIVAADLSPTLQGDPATIKAQGAFVTVSCGTPFAVSAGIGFHTIEQKQFAILQSPDGKGGAINTFGVTNDSNITPVALALVHVRLAEWNRHKYSFYGSLGVGGACRIKATAPPYNSCRGLACRSGARCTLPWVPTSETRRA